MSESPFLNLPAEIRNEIYSLLLIAIPPLGSPRDLRQNLDLHPSILSVCRQTYHEATRVLYSKNTFIAHYSLLSGLPQLRRRHPPVKAAHLIALIRRYHVYVRLDCDAHFTAETAKQSFTGAEELTVEVFQAQFGSSDCAVLRLFEGIRGVKKAKVEGSSLGFRNYQAWLERVMMCSESTEIEDFDEERVGEQGEYDIWTVSPHDSISNSTD